MKNIIRNKLFAPIISLFLIFTPLKAEVNVVTSIKPLHSLTSYIMDGVGEPGLIIDGVASPHNFQIKPSHAKMLQKADLVIWVGEDLESFLPTALKSIPKNSVVLELLDQSGLKKLKFREKNIFEGHDDHGHDEHGKKEDDHDDHGDEEHAKKEEGHDDHGHDEHGHAHGEYDPHIWLDPLNAKVIVKKITNQLVKIDSANSSTYKSNSKNLLKDLDALTKTIKKDLNKNASFVVFHDAYQYFEKHFNISASGAISLGDASDPSPARVKEIKDRVEKEDIHCVLAEPQYKVGLVKAVIEGTHANMAVIDPLGVGLEAGPTLYDKLIRNLATNLSKCF